jgi:hypothetical protein
MNGKIKLQGEEVVYNEENNPDGIITSVGVIWKPLGLLQNQMAFPTLISFVLI